MHKSIVELHGVSFRYPSGTLALDSVSMAFPKAKKIALLGGNGAGKSTLMLLLNGILSPSSGYLKFELEKYSYRKSKLRELRLKVGLLFHDSDNQLIAPTVYEEISFGLNNISKDKVWVRGKVEDAIKAFSLEELRNCAPHELSTGQKKRVCLASILAMEPELIVCDEPASSLDPFHAKLTFNYLDDLNEKGKTILISTHDVNHAFSWADYVFILNKGQLLIGGSPEEVFAKKDLIVGAGLDLPFFVETCNELFPNLDDFNYPKSIIELKKLLSLYPEFAQGL